MTELTAPIGKVIIRKDEPVSVTENGILLRPNDRAKSNTGVRYDTGEKIFFSARVSSTINFKGENLLIISEEDIMGTYD